MAEFQKALIRFLYVSLAIATVVALLCLGKPNRSSVSSGRPGVDMPAGVTAIGTCVVRTKPDIVEVDLGVAKTDTKVKTVQRYVNTTATTITKLLEKNGIEAKDVQTQEFNIYPETRPNGTKTGRWSAKQVLHVRIRNIGKAADIIDSVVGVGVNSVSGLNYTSENMEELRTKGRQKAADSARKKAQALASALGGKVGKLVSCAENYPDDGMYMANSSMRSMTYSVGGLASAELDIAPGELVTTVTVTATYEIE